MDEINEPYLNKDKAEKKGRSRKILEKLPPIIQIPTRFLGKILISGAKTIGSFILIILFFSILGNMLSGPLGGSSHQEVQLFGKGPNKILVIPLQGIILNQPQPLGGSSGSITPEDVRDVLKDAEEDEHIKGVILSVESPGGSAVASDRIYVIINDFRQRTGKPVVTLMGDTVASGGYYISVATDKIIANPATITGSIGVIASTINVEEFMGKLGIKEVVFKKGKYKDILSSTRESTDEEKTIIDSVLDDAYQQFINRVVTGRKFSHDKARSLATGRIFSGIQAREEGLIDELGNLDEAVRETKSLANIDDALVVRLQTGGFLEKLFSGMRLGILSRLFSSTPTPKVWYLMR